MPSAVALNQVLWQIDRDRRRRALAGVLIARTSPTAAYAVDLVSYAGLFVAAIAIQPLPPLPSPDGERPVGVRAVRESIRYVGHHRLIRSTFVIDLIAMIFGMPAALFPVLAVEQFHRGPRSSACSSRLRRSAHWRSCSSPDRSRGSAGREKP